MDERRQDRDPGPAASQARETIRAHGFELLDDAGRTRAILDSSRLWDHGPEAPRLRFYGRDGDERAWFGFHDTGLALGFVQGGNEVSQMGVNDPDTEAVEPGCYLLLGDSEGAPVLRWCVHSDGEAIIDQPPGTPSVEREEC